MKKALYVATVDVHIKTFHLPYLKLLHDNGYEVHVATNGDEQFTNCDVKHTICIERSPFKLNNIKAIGQLKKIIEKENFDIIHCHTPMGAVVTRLAAKNARKKGARVIYTAHGFHFFKGAPLLNWMLFYPIEKFLAKYTDTLITINQEDYNLAKNKFSKRCKDIQYVPGVGIDTKKFDFKMTPKEKKELRKSFGLKDNDFVMIFPARLDKNKNQIFLIECMKILEKKYNNIHLLLPGTDELNGYYQSVVEESKLKNIHFLGFRNDIPRLMKISNIAVSSSLREGLPVNVIEAFACGIPVVALKCRGMEDLINKSEYGCILKNDVQEFSNKILDIYRSSVDSNALVKHSNDYNINRVIKMVEDIYFNKKKVLIIPNCTDLNRGDQALVLETKKVVDSIFDKNICYMMSEGNVKQCEDYGLIKFSDILKHPSRFSKKNNNVKYGFFLKVKWGIIALFDLFFSLLVLNKITRKIVVKIVDDDLKKSINIFENADYVFVKGGGFLHDYSGGLTGIYTMYYQTFHIRLALAMHKKVFVMPNSFGPFKSKLSSMLVKNTLNKCSLVTSRESISSNEKTNGLEKRIKLYPDLAFSLKKKNDNVKIHNLLNDLNIDVKSDKLIAITVRPYRFYSYENPEQKYMEYKKAFVDLINYLRKKDYKILLVVHTTSNNDHENDEKCIDDIIEMMSDNKGVYKIKNNDFDCYDLKELYGYCQFVIGTRFHSVIFSLEQLIPCIAVTYGGNKGDGIMRDIGISEYAIKIDQMSSSIIIDKFEMLEKNRVDVVQKLDNYVEKSKVEYEKLLDDIRELI